MRYIKGRTSVYNINYHIIWCIKYRRKVITPEIENRLYKILNDIAKERGFEIVKAKVGEGDHIHVFVSAPPKYSVSQIVKWLKGITGRLIMKEFHDEIYNKLWTGHFWNGSYFVETIGSTSEENMMSYIERQKHVQL